MGSTVTCGGCCQSSKGVEDISVPKNKSMLTQNKLTAHHAKAFLITCMDFRLFNDTNRILKERGYNVNYDQFVLAGVSLGLVQQKFPGWGKSVLDHIGISIKLHQINKVILLDHLDCGAYKTFCPDLKKEDDYNEHKKNLKLAKEMINEAFPSITVKTWILHLDGQLDRIKE